MENEVLQEHQNDVPETDESREGVAPSPQDAPKKKRKSREERKAALNERKEKILAQLRKITAQENAQERKKRNHRLIKLGAEVEKVCGFEINDDNRARFISYLQGQKDGGWIDKAMS